MPPNPLPPCARCQRSAWVHALRGAWLYCDNIGGDKSTHTEDEVNFVRGTIGKKPSYRPPGV